MKHRYLHVNKTNFHMKGFALGRALKQRRKTTRKSPIANITQKMEDGFWGALRIMGEIAFQI